MTLLGNGLFSAEHYDDALSVGEAKLAMERRLGAPEDVILVAQANLATTYQLLGRTVEAVEMFREVYSGHLKLGGEEDENTLNAANNYASTLRKLERFEEAKALLRKVMPVARRVLGESHRLTLKMRKIYARALYNYDDATLDDLREAVATLAEIERTARRVFGGAHPDTVYIEQSLRNARAALRARETPSPGDA